MNGNVNKKPTEKRTAHHNLPHMILAIFLASFAALQMQTVFFMGHEVGIVWTSIIYHATETIGLLVLALYLSKKYKGL